MNKSSEKPDPQLTQAMALHRAGRLAQAEPFYRKAAAAHPKDGRYLYLLGLCLLDQGKLAEGRTVMSETVAMAPLHAGAHYTLGRLLAHGGEDDAAKKHLCQAVTLGPTIAEHHLELGNLQAKMNDMAGAVASFRAGLRMAPKHAGLKANLGTALYLIGERSEAIRSWREALERAPKLSEARLGLANALRNQGDLAGAEQELRKASAGDPKNAQVRYSLGVTLRHRGESAAAIVELEQARALAPDMIECRVELARCYQHICAWDELEQLMPTLQGEFDKAVAGQPCAISAFFALSLPFKPEERVAVARNECLKAKQRAMTEWRGAAPFAFSASPRDRLTIGYLSSDLREHPMSHLIGYLFGAHDRDHVSVDVYSTGPDDGSVYRQRIAESADRFFDVRELSNTETAKLIHKNGVDILLELNGPTRMARQEVAALRPAPIVATWIGYPGATGAPDYDYAIADAVVAPPAMEHLYTERLCRLPHTYFPNDRWPPLMGSTSSREAEGLPAEGMVFCCFCVPYKIERETFRRWMAILHAVPGSVLWLLSGAQAMQARLHAAAMAADIDPARVIFAARKPKPDHLARIGLADLMLDTVTYGGHTTVSDALLAGVPAMSRLGEDFPSRVGASLLTTLGLTDLIVPDLDGYERLAVTLGNDAAARSAIRSRLASAQPRSILFDPQRFAHSLERGYAEMWRIHSAGEKPRTFDLRAEEGGF
jgi:predicted O-linked N-acetylglucosamine transferase (SPINDLY family)